MTNNVIAQAAKPAGIEDPYLKLKSSYWSYDERVPADFKLNLRGLVRIRVLDDFSAPGCPDYSPKGYMLMVDDRGVGNVNEGRTNAVIIHVSAKNLDYLIAALRRLSPDAKLKHGVGM